MNETRLFVLHEYVRKYVFQVEPVGTDYCSYVERSENSFRLRMQFSLSRSSFPKTWMVFLWLCLSNGGRVRRSQAASVNAPAAKSFSLPATHPPWCAPSSHIWLNVCRKYIRTSGTGTLTLKQYRNNRTQLTHSPPTRLAARPSLSFPSSPPS